MLVKHPFFGAVFTSMEWLHCFRRVASSADTCPVAAPDACGLGDGWAAAKFPQV